MRILFYLGWVCSGIVGIGVWILLESIKRNRKVKKAAQETKYCSKCELSFPIDDEELKYCPHCNGKLEYHIEYMKHMNGDDDA